MSKNRKKRQYPKIKMEKSDKNINFSFHELDYSEIQKLHDRISRKSTN